MIEFPVVERLERREVLHREEVNDEGLFGGGELEQAHLSVARVEGRGLDVGADGRRAREGLGDGGEFFRVGDEAVGRGAFLHTAILAGWRGYTSTLAVG